MKSVYVIVKSRINPGSVDYDTPHKVYASRRVARKRVGELNKKADRYFYWLRRVHMDESSDA